MFFSKIQNGIFLASMAASIVSGYPLYQNNTQVVLSARDNTAANNESESLENTSGNSDTGVAFTWNNNKASSIAIQDDGINRARALHLGTERNTLPEIYLRNLYKRGVTGWNGPSPNTVNETDKTTLQTQSAVNTNTTTTITSPTTLNLLQQALIHQSVLSAAIHNATATFENSLDPSSDLFDSFYSFDIALGELAPVVLLPDHDIPLSIDLTNLTPEHFELAMQVQMFLEDLVRRYITLSKTLLLPGNEDSAAEDIDVELDVNVLSAIAKDDNFIEIFQVGLVDKIKEAKMIYRMKELELEEEQEKKKHADEANNLEQKVKKVIDAYVNCKIPGLCVFNKLRFYL